MVETAWVEKTRGRGELQEEMRKAGTYCKDFLLSSKFETMWGLSSSCRVAIVDHWPSLK